MNESLFPNNTIGRGSFLDNKDSLEDDMAPDDNKTASNMGVGGETLYTADNNNKIFSNCFHSINKLLVTTRIRKIHHFPFTGNINTNIATLPVKNSIAVYTGNIIV